MILGNSRVHPKYQANWKWNCICSFYDVIMYERSKRGSNTIVWGATHIPRHSLPTMDPVTKLKNSLVCQVGLWWNSFSGLLLSGLLLVPYLETNRHLSISPPGSYHKMVNIFIKTNSNVSFGLSHAEYWWLLSVPYFPFTFWFLSSSLYTLVRGLLVFPGVYIGWFETTSLITGNQSKTTDVRFCFIS